MGQEGSGPAVVSELLLQGSEQGSSSSLGRLPESPSGMFSQCFPDAVAMRMRERK